MRARQRGITLTGLIMGSFVLAFEIATSAFLIVKYSM